MCNTPWCFGDCEDCLRDKADKEEWERLTPCPHSPGPYVPQSQCGLKTVSVKQDACSKCGLIVNY